MTSSSLSASSLQIRKLLKGREEASRRQNKRPHSQPLSLKAGTKEILNTGLSKIDNPVFTCKMGEIVEYGTDDVRSILEPSNYL